MSQAVASNKDELITQNKIHPLSIAIIKKIIIEKYPEYYQSFRKVMNRKYAHLLNMFICKRDILNKYCEWLFPALCDIEAGIEMEKRIKHKDRIIGMIAERLLDVWIENNKLKIKECFTINTERLDWKMW